MNATYPDPGSPLEAIHQAERTLRERVEAARAEAEARVSEARQEALRRVTDARCRVDEIEQTAHADALAGAEAEARRIREGAEAEANALAGAMAPRIGRLVADAVALILGEDPC